MRRNFDKSRRETDQTNPVHPSPQKDRPLQAGRDLTKVTGESSSTKAYGGAGKLAELWKKSFSERHNTDSTSSFDNLLRDYPKEDPHTSSRGGSNLGSRAASTYSVTDISRLHTPEGGSNPGSEAASTYSVDNSFLHPEIRLHPRIYQPSESSQASSDPGEVTLYWTPNEQTIRVAHYTKEHTLSRDDFIKELVNRGINREEIKTDRSGKGEAYYEDMMLMFQTLRPFIQKWGGATRDYEATYRQAASEMRQPDFLAAGKLLTVWGCKPRPNLQQPE